MVARRKSYLDDDDDDQIVADGQSVRCPIYLMDATQRAVTAKFSAVRLDDHRPGYRGGGDPRAAYRRYCRDNDLPQPDPSAIANESAYQASKIRISNAWKTPPNLAAGKPADPDDVDLAARVASILRLNPPLPRSSAPSFTDPAFKHVGDARAAALAARDAMVKRNSEAWRDCRCDAAEPGIHSRPQEWQAHRAGPPQLDPDAASAVQRRLENERGANPDIAKLTRDLEAARARNLSAFSDRLQNAWRGGA